MIAQFLRRQGIRTFAGHDETLVFHEETPSGIADLLHVKSQHVSIISGRAFKIMHGDNISCTLDHLTFPSPHLNA